MQTSKLPPKRHANLTETRPHHVLNHTFSSTCTDTDIRNVQVDRFDLPGRRSLADCLTILPHHCQPDSKVQTGICRGDSKHPTVKDTRHCEQMSSGQSLRVSLNTALRSYGQAESRLQANLPLRCLVCSLVCSMLVLSPSHLTMTLPTTGIR